MPRDPHDRTASTWTFRLPVHHPRVEVGVVVEVVLRPEVEGVEVEVEAEVLHHPEVAGVVGAVGAVGAQGQDRSLREEAAAAVRREALFFLAEVEAVQV
jgi:hypothetical protein